MPAIIGLPFDAADTSDHTKQLAAVPPMGGGDAAAVEPAFGVGVTLSPTGGWEELVAAARLADELGLDAVGFWDQVNREDWEVCRLTQLGMQTSGYVEGRYTTEEDDVHRFDRMVADRYAAALTEGAVR